ncbi:MAG: hypothetical protein IAE90_00280 [Ignavibacteria bacterium]|nr:hypothetical protein [Ignavibacteria bacterium]
MPEFFKSKFHDIKLVITGTEEPNNGRELWVADIYMNGINQTEKYFGSWNWLNWNLQNYVMDSPDGSYVFIPAEGGGFLINTSTLERIDLPYNALSTIKFLKNEFTGNALKITYTDEVISVDLHTLKLT